MTGIGLTANELTYMRDTIEQLLPDTCNLLTATIASNDFGGFSETWGTVTANVACRIDYTSGDEQLFGDSQRPYRGYILTVPYDTTITSDYRVEIGSATYAIKAVDNGKSWAACLRAALEAV